jgi:hypothetical protein
VIERHIREHASSDHRSAREALAAAGDLIEIVRAYLK